MDKPIIILEIPHQRNAFAWIAWDGEIDIIVAAHRMESDNNRYIIYTLQDLQDGFGREELPDDAWKIAERDGKVGEVDNDGFMPVDQMPKEFDWAWETLVHDLSSGSYFRNHAEVLDDLETRFGHQAIKAKIALESAADDVGTLWDDYKKKDNDNGI